MDPFSGTFRQEEVWPSRVAGFVWVLAALGAMTAAHQFAAAIVLTVTTTLLLRGLDHLPRLTEEQQETDFPG